MSSARVRNLGTSVIRPTRPVAPTSLSLSDAPGGLFQVLNPLFQLFNSEYFNSRPPHVDVRKIISYFGLESNTQTIDFELTGQVNWPITFTIVSNYSIKSSY